MSPSLDLWYIHRPRLILVVLFILLSCSHAESYASELLPPTLVWQQLYSHQDWNDNHPCLMHTPEGLYLAGISHRRQSAHEYAYSLWILKLGTTGERLWNKVLSIPGLDRLEPITWSKCLALDNERVLLVQESLPKTGTWLLHLGPEGQIEQHRQLDLGRGGTTLRDFKRVPGGFLITGQKHGRDGYDAWVIKLDNAGLPLWEKMYDNGHTEDAFSIVVENNGGFTFAADSGQYNKFGGGSSQIWVVCCDAKGQVRTEATVPGRHPTLILHPNGTYALAANIADFPKLTMQVQGLDPKLQQTWGPHILYRGNGLGLYPLRIDAVGHYIVIGSQFGKPWLWRFSVQGQLLDEQSLV